MLRQDRFVYSIITKKGRALNILFERLRRAADRERNEWKEDEALKSVSALYQLGGQFHSSSLSLVR